MKSAREKLFKVEQTGEQIGRLARQYWQDMADLVSLTPPQLFGFLQAIPYRRDPPGVELVQRPLFLRMEAARGADCDDRATAVAAWAIASGYPWRVVAVSRRPDLRLHHVFTEVRLGSSWVPIDPTYPTSSYGRPENWTARKTLAEG